MTLPPSLPRDGFFTGTVPPNRWGVEVGGVTYNIDNVNSLWSYDEEHQPPGLFTRATATGIMQKGVWVKGLYGRWVFGYGQGERDSYEGNRDAGQLWLDLHTDNPPEREYHPRVVNLRDNVTWFGMGQRIPIDRGTVRGKAEIFLRVLRADELLTRAVTGDIQDGNYTGMVRKIESGAHGDSAWGWALDARVDLRVGDRWQLVASADGLLGELSWHNALVGDYYVTSPQVFQDPEGFLHNVWGITGQTWNEDITIQVNPVYVNNLIYRGNPNLLFGLLTEDGDTQLNIGAGWPTRQGGFNYARFWPNGQRLELGATGRHWQFSIAGDGFIVSAKHHFAITLAAGPFVF